MITIISTWECLVMIFFSQENLHFFQYLVMISNNKKFETSILIENFKIIHLYIVNVLTTNFEVGTY